ncbi:DDE family transposase [Paenibacillus prosopidis]|uniref:DDE family transposase n=1 Tax=Paenibacillus prosopidis TaxID=630520 RepID=A0A368WBR8_9BACL|nr:DDE family transposase [Paenibacillus prosopidis]
MKFITKIANIKTEFSMRNATNIAGSKIMLAYLEKIKLAKAFHALGYAKSPNSVFPTYRILLYFIVGWMLGCERVFHFQRLQKDTLMRRFLGGRCPHHSLLYKELERLGKQRPTLSIDLKKLNMEMVSPCLPQTVILDFDSTVETLYGNQQGAAVGVNSYKPGRKSYHPILVYEGQSRFLLNAELRPGNVHSSSDVLAFAEKTLSLLSSRPVSYVRFDKGFGGEAFYSFWESRKIGYVGKMKWTERLQK